MRWILVMFLLMGMALTAEIVFGRSSSQVKMVNIDQLGIQVFDGDGHVLSPPSGVKIIVRQFGQSQWPREYWTQISGHPDPVDGSLKQTVPFPVDPTFIDHLKGAYQQAHSQ